MAGSAKSSSGKDSPASATDSDMESAASGKGSNMAPAKKPHQSCCNPPSNLTLAKKYMKLACKVCPPCRAPCSPGAPPEEALEDVALMSATLAQMEEGFRQKIAECALLRDDVQECRLIAERERAVSRDACARLRDLEKKFNSLGEDALALLRIKAATLDQGPAVRAMKQCYRETREEADQLRLLLEEQSLQVQDYRAKYQAAQQLVEEQKKQMATMEIDNSRIAEQINLEIHAIKLNFQQRLTELSPLPDVLVATQRKLDETYTAKALAEHAAAITEDELHVVRERVHMLILLTKDKPKIAAVEKSADDKVLTLVQQRLQQLTEINMALRSEIERQRTNSNRLEEAVITCEKRLQEKMHECAALGGELERTREEAQRAVLCAQQRHDTVHKCMDETLADMQNQLEQTRKRLDTIEKDKETTRCRLMCQLNRLQGRFDMADLRVLGLQTQVDGMIHALPADSDQSEADEVCECMAIDT